MRQIASVFFGLGLLIASAASVGATEPPCHPAACGSNTNQVAVGGNGGDGFGLGLNLGNVNTAGNGAPGYGGDAYGGDAVGGDGGPVFVGNGGNAEASANGGTISLGDINTGGNTGNVIEVNLD